MIRVERTYVRSESERLWRERRFYQLLNRMLFRAAEPTNRYRILEHFYRLPQKTIARFYAGKLTSLDKLKPGGHYSAEHFAH